MAQPSARLRRSCPANELKNVPALGTLNTRCEMGVGCPNKSKHSAMPLKLRPTGVGSSSIQCSRS